MTLFERLPVLSKAALITSGALHAAVGAAYQVMYPDGIAYLDVADAYMRADWSTAINPVWSPFVLLDSRSCFVGRAAVRALGVPCRSPRKLRHLPGRTHCV